MEDQQTELDRPGVTGHQFRHAVDDEAESLPVPNATGNALAEANGNAVSDRQQVPTDAKKKVNWGGDSKDVTSDDENQEPDNTDLVTNDSAAALAPKKKKKKKSKSGKKGLNAPTGFEEYYVDVPVTPEEFEEEKTIYHRSKTFSERIETAIQRYISKRKFDSERKDLFDKYMVYGGVSAGPKMFGGGLDSKTLEESTAADIAQLTATNYVDFNTEDPRSSEYVVDFDGVVKGFLSSRLHQSFSVETEQQIKQYTTIIRNFLNYLLHHDVCPEYNDQINAARATCDLAEKELWSVTQAARLLPGDFNKACSVIFGGSFQDTYIGDQEWTHPMDINKGMSPDRARKVFLAGLAALSDSEVLKKYNNHVGKNRARVVEVIETGLEVLDMEYANQEVIKYYSSKDNPIQGVSPLGKMRVATWYNPAAPPEDLTEEEKAGTAHPLKPIYTYTLWVEDDVMSKLFVGMKLAAHIRKLSFGPIYFDTVTEVHCSFYEILPNELMLGWREHKYLPPRPKNHNASGDYATVYEKGEGTEVTQNGEGGAEYEQGEDIVIEE